MRLTGPQRRQLHDALLIAFPDREALERLASFELNAPLNHISTGNTYSSVVLSMINHYEKTIGQLEELIEAARRTNPTNPELRDFYEHIWLPLKGHFEEKQNAQQINTSSAESEENNESTYRDSSDQAYKEKQVRYSNFLRNKAREFGIDLNTSPEGGMVLVCKYVLERISAYLSQDLRKIPRDYVDVLEKDLREISNEFERMGTHEARKLIDLKLVKSASAVIAFVEKAYTEICAASMMLDNKNNEVNYIVYFNHLKQCQKEMNKALQEFLV